MCSPDFEALQLVKVAQIIGKDLFLKKRTLIGMFIDSCQEHSVPASLKALMSFILDGPMAIEQPEFDSKAERQAVLMLSRLIAFNCHKTAKDTSFQWHNKERETPLPIYLGLKLLTEREKKTPTYWHTFGPRTGYFI